MVRTLLSYARQARVGNSLADAYPPGKGALAMLDEWVERLLTTCPRHLREMGLLREMLGIRRRWQKYGKDWQPHCQRSRAVVLEAIRRCSRHRRAVVLGSGWLHDVPLPELSLAFEEVTLVDLFHPR